MDKLCCYDSSLVNWEQRDRIAGYIITATTLVAAACWALDRSRAKLSLGLSAALPFAYMGVRALLYRPPPDSLDLLCALDRTDPSEIERASPSQVEQFVRTVDELTRQHDAKFESGIWSSFVPHALLPVIGPKLSAKQLDQGVTSLFSRCMNMGAGQTSTLAEKLSRLRALIGSATAEQRASLTGEWPAGRPPRDSTLFYTLEFGLWRDGERVVTERQLRWLYHWLHMKQSATRPSLTATAPAA